MKQGLPYNTQPELQRALQANFAEEMACMARVLPYGELHEDADFCWFFTGRSGFNGVLRTSIASHDTAYIHNRIDKLLAYFQQKGVPIGWPISPLAYPANLASYLEAHAMTYRSSNTVMILNIDSLPEHNTAMPANLSIREIQEDETLKQWRSITINGFECTEELGQTYYEAYSRIGFDKNWHHYIGWLHDRPVATTSLLLHAGVAGIYGVTTLAEARRLGIGTAMTTHALREAQRFGYRTATLSPSVMGQRVYERLGFQEYYKNHFYQWAPNN